jgi:hypothetical protein
MEGDYVQLPLGGVLELIGLALLVKRDAVARANLGLARRYPLGERTYRSNLLMVWLVGLGYMMVGVLVMARARRA